MDADTVAWSAASRLGRWARFAVHHRWQVLGAWVVAAVALALLAATVGGRFADRFSLPGAESQAAVDLLQQRFPSQAGDSATLVFRHPAGIADPAVAARIDAVLADAATLPEVVGVVGPSQNPGAVSADGTIGYATVLYASQAFEVEPASVEALTDLVDRADGDGLQIEAGGQIIASSEIAPPGTSELVGLAAAVVILLAAFGSVIAMGLPIATALVGLGTGFLVILLVARGLDVSTFTPAFASMIGIGVGIDYALFVVTRFREGLGAGLSVDAAVARAIDTAGRAVIFAGSVVVIALLGLFAIGIPFVAALGVAAAVVVVLSVLVAVTLLPALLGFAGRAIDRWRVPALHADPGGDEGTFGYRLSRRIQQRPLGFALAAVAVLLALAIPVLDLRLGFADAGNNPTNFRTRRAYDLLAAGFGPGFNGPLLVTVERDGALDPAALDGLVAALRATPGIAAVSPPTPNPAGDTAVVTAIPTTSPQDAATDDLVARLRDGVIPAALAGTGMAAYVGGPTAAFIDIGDQIGDRMPRFFAIVIGLSFLLLMAVFRSLVVPLKAAVMNLLSIGAAYGVLVAVFQWGWGNHLIGLAETGPIETFLPLMLFAILFGLSMDYEVFLLSRIREAYLAGDDTRDAVAHGLAVTARVITAAAAIMIAVFLSFVLGPDRIVKEFGLGLGTAILVDATLVRLILVPSVMAILGEVNWWFPAWLDRLVPRLDVEGRPAVASREAD